MELLKLQKNERQITAEVSMAPEGAAKGTGGAATAVLVFGAGDFA